MIPGIQFKSFNNPIEDVDEKGVVTIYVNAFGNEDSDGDISEPDSFTKTITDNFTRIKHFLNHDGRLLIGIPLKFEPDSFGLKTRSKLNLKKEIGRDAYEDYKLYKENDRTLEHSFGYEVLRRDQKDKRRIQEYKLWEYSTLTAWGANYNTPLVDMKNIDMTSDQLEKHIEELTEMYNRKYSDTRLRSIEFKLITLTSSPDNDAPEDTSTHLIAPDLKEVEAINQFKKTFTLN
jgi:HK97 family phage prohead protease